MIKSLDLLSAASVHAYPSIKASIRNQQLGLVLIKKDGPSHFYYHKTQALPANWIIIPSFSQLFTDRVYKDFGTAITSDAPYPYPTPD